MLTNIEMDEESGLILLPGELIYVISRYLDSYTLLKLSTTCKKMWNFEILWKKKWKELSGI